MDSSSSEKILKREYLQLVKNLSMNSSSDVKILVWIHQATIVLVKKAPSYNFTATTQPKRTLYQSNQGDQI
jgi:hypothetical protein